MPDYRIDCNSKPTMTEEEWRAEHDEHKGFLRQEYLVIENEVQPPSYRLYMLKCPGCGARLQCMEDPK